jgi:hypothetical protein
LGQAQRCGGVKPVNGSPTFFLFIFFVVLLVQMTIQKCFVSFEEEFEDTKEVIRIRKSKKNRQHNDQKKKYKQ